MTQGLIFDYGGTLDTGGCHWGKVLWHAYQRHQVPVGELRFRQAYVHGERTLGARPVIRPDFTFRQTLQAKLALQMDFLGLDGYVPSLLDDLYEQTKDCVGHSRGVLQQLGQRGLPLVLVSNFYGNMRTVLREFGLDGLFQAVVESAVVGIRKPDPRIFLLGVEALGLSPSVVTVVGDSMAKDIVPARRAGCSTVWLKGEQWDDAPVDEAAADCVVTDLNELLEIIDKD